MKGVGVFPYDGLYDAAINYNLECKFAPGASPVAPDGFTMLVADQATFHMGTRFIGTEGEIFVDRGDTLEANPASILDSEIGENEIRLYKSENHAQNFFECVRSREQCIAPIHAAHRAISIAHLGNIAMQLGREVHWDPAEETFPNDPTAVRKLKRAMRGNWHI
jgi:hypothetical protein